MSSYDESNVWEIRKRETDRRCKDFQGGNISEACHSCRPLRLALDCSHLPFVHLESDCKSPVKWHLLQLALSIFMCRFSWSELRVATASGQHRGLTLLNPGRRPSRTRNITGQIGHDIF